MTYLALNAIFLLVAVALAVTARRIGRLPSRTIAAMGITAVIVLALTAVFDNVMISVGLFSYDSHRILGLKLGLAPIEDFGYPLAAVILLPALCALFERSEGPTDD